MLEGPLDLLSPVSRKLLGLFSCPSTSLLAHSFRAIWVLGHIHDQRRKKRWYRAYCLLLPLLPQYPLFRSMVNTAASSSSPRPSVQWSHHPDEVQRMATTKSYLWEALLGGVCLHVDFFLRHCLGWPLWRTTEMLFSTGLSMFCCATTSFILSLFSSFLKFCIFSFACCAALQICTAFSKLNSKCF